MGLNTLFESAVDTAFQVFKDLAKPGKYLVRPEESGWGDDEAPIEHSMEVIVNGLSQDDKKETSFYTEIQPSDTIVMVKGKDIAANSIRVRNSDKFQIQFKSYTSEFNIIASDTDPAEALYLILLRDVKNV